MKQYAKVQIDRPPVGVGYQEINEQGECLRVTDQTGETVDAVEYHITDAKCERPTWAD